MCYRYIKESLFLGDLSGNHFTVALRCCTSCYPVCMHYNELIIRNVSAEDVVVDEAVKALKQSGFINYFGMQRFGTAAAPTYAIGK